MVLTSDEILARIEKPVNQSHIKNGIKQEKRHRLHVNGDAKELDNFLKKIDALETKETYELRKRFTKAYTKSIYAQIKNLFFKATSTQGNVVKFTFTNPDYEDDFQNYLDTHWHDGFFSSLHEQIKQICFTSFQGVFMVDLPVEPTSNEIEPFYQFIPSNQIWDINVDGNEITFLLLRYESKEVTADGKEEVIVRFTAIDDQRFATYRQRDKDYYLESESFHDLGFVPACVITKLAAKDDNDVERTSLISASLEHADVLLEDHSEHQLNKRLHAFQEKWSYATECETCHGSKTATYLIEGEEFTLDCKTCNGAGKVFPAGPDKIYAINPPETKEDAVVALPPAGYVVKDLEPTRYLFEQMNEEEMKIPKSIFSREGIVSFNTKQTTATEKEIDTDSAHDKIREFSENIEHCVRFILETMAIFRYRDRFVSLHVSYNKNYSLRSAGELEKMFAEKKKAGLEDNMLLPYLEEIIYSKYRNNPDRLEKELLKLHLTPFPSLTLSEVINLPFVSEEQKRMKANINNYLQRFEEENGDIIVFGSLLPPDQKLKKVREIFNQYNAENNVTDERFNQEPGAGQRTGGKQSA